MSRVLSLDVETACIADLKKTGASRYSRDPSLIVTVIAWAFDDDPVKSYTPFTKIGLPHEIRTHIEAGGKVRAWNAFFEFCILRNYFGVDVKPEQMVCTMQAALHAGLPGALGDCGPALKLNIVKDTTAHALMLRMAKPRSVSPLVWWHNTDKDKLAALEKYCRRDVEAEREIAKNIPPLPDREMQISIMDRKANSHGLYLDQRLIDAMLSIADAATARLNARCAQITNGQVTSPGSQTARLLEWLRPYAPVDLSRASVEEALKRQDLPDHIREALELRQLAAKSSVKKLKAMLNCVDPDGAVRGVLAYYGANRTGRFAGRLIQPQNFPRPSIKKPNQAIDMILKGGDAAGLDLLFGTPLNVLASCLRGTIIPRPGKKLLVCDASQIEARVVAWLAGQKDILDVFARGDDVYTYTANKNGSTDRQFGKVLVLACGFGMGPSKFQDTAKTYGISLSGPEAEAAVSGWRDANSHIRQLWWDTDKIVKNCIRAYALDGAPHVLKINDKLSVRVGAAKNGSPLMTILLPSGRNLFYRDIRLETDPADPRREQIVYSGSDPNTKKWGSVRTYGGKLVENITQAVARDIVIEQALWIEHKQLCTLILSVHDELIFEEDAERAVASFEEVKRLMSTSPAWAQGLPSACDGHIMERYGK